LNNKHKIYILVSFCFALTILPSCSNNKEKLDYTLQDGIEFYKQEEYSKAFDIILKFAKQGVPEAQSLIGFMYKHGMTKKALPNFEEANKWYLKAAVQGDVQAQYHMGVSFERGVGIKQDYTRAVKWYIEAGEQGNVKAQYNLGVLYSSGKYVNQNLDSAFFWYQNAGELNHLMAQNNLGIMYMNGLGTEVNVSNAVKWFKKAASQNNSNAQYNLGTLFFNGVGVPENKKTAKNWFQKSADQGNEEAIKALEENFE